MKKEIEQELEALGMEPTWDDRYYPLDNLELEELEALIGAELPSDYREFVQKYGGASFGENIVEIKGIEPVPPNIGKAEFGTFYGNKECKAKLLWYKHVLKDRMAENMIPIGNDLAGPNSFCLGVSGTDRDKVYMWDYYNDHEESDYTDEGLPVPENMFYLNLTLMANSFEEFILRMEIERDPFEESDRIWSAHQERGR